jgi:hypothetical protein
LTEYELKNKVFKFVHIYDEKTAIAFWKTFNDHPSGGDTEVGVIIEMIRKEIEDNHRLFNLDVDLSKEKPEILVINDGQDSVKTSKFNWKTNALCLYQDNPELKKLCERTGGLYKSINENI